MRGMFCAALPKLCPMPGLSWPAVSPNLRFDFASVRKPGCGSLKLEMYILEFEHAGYR